MKMLSGINYERTSGSAVINLSLCLQVVFQWKKNYLIVLMTYQGISIIPFAE